MHYRILVVGYKGVVGNATYQLLNRLGYRVHGIDVGDEIIESDIAFICLPEALVVPEQLASYKTSLFVVRSTVPPGTCENIQDRLGIHTLHNPAFLREITAIMDSFNPDRVVIGECCKEHGDIINGIYEALRRPIYRSCRKVTELMKLACNGWLATVISYWNEVDEIAKRLGISGTEVGMLASTDPRIGFYGSRFHSKFGEKCLRKDLRHLINVARSTGTNPMLLESLMRVNENEDSCNDSCSQ